MVNGATRILNPGPLRHRLSARGASSTPQAFLIRYPTTATNRNRARSRWTYYNFLGLDIEKSASRTTDPVALADTNNPTMYNPACTVCHSRARPCGRRPSRTMVTRDTTEDQWGGVGLPGWTSTRRQGGAVRGNSGRDMAIAERRCTWPVTLAGSSREIVSVYMFTNRLRPR